jgi:predicted amidohydrolase
LRDTPVGTAPPEYEALFTRLAKESGLYIIGGTHPIIQSGELFNAAHLFTPNGQVFRQKKVHLTSTEKESYPMSRGHGFYCYNTDYGNADQSVIEFDFRGR